VSVLLVAAFFAGCGSAPDPLAAKRVVSPLEEDWVPHASVVLSEQALGRLIEDAFPDGKALSMPGPLGMALIAQPTLTGARVSTDKAQAGARVSAQLDGEIDVTAGPLFSIRDLPWHAEITGELDLVFRPGLLNAAWAEPPTIAVRLDGLPPQVEAVASGFLQGWAEEQADDLLAAVNAPLPSAVRTGRLRAEGGLVLDLRLHGAAPEAAWPLPPPGGGIAIGLHYDGVLTAADHVALGQDPEARWVVEPRTLVVEPPAWTAEVRVWKRSRREKWQDHALHGEIRIADGQLLVGTSGAQRLATQSVGGIASKAIDSRVREAATSLSPNLDLRLGPVQPMWHELRVDENVVVLRGVLKQTDD